MNVLVDTPIWSLALRRSDGHLNPGERRLVDEWAALIREGRVQVIGMIRQEILSGIRSEKDFERVRAHLSAFDDVVITTSDHEDAARFFNRCRTRGVTATPIDLLICSVALRHSLSIFTTDRDFDRLTGLLGIELHAPRHRG